MNREDPEDFLLFFLIKNPANGQVHAGGRSHLQLNKEKIKNQK